MSKSTVACTQCGALTARECECGYVTYYCTGCKQKRELNLRYFDVGRVAGLEEQNEQLKIMLQASEDRNGELLRERDEAREAARWFWDAYRFREQPSGKACVEKWPWLNVGAG